MGNILLIGNGFDIAHDLPTKYEDFLSTMRVVYSIVVENNLSPEYGKLNNRVKEILEQDRKNKWKRLVSYSEEWKKLIADNIWLEYFWNNSMYQKENWIDFEKEISKVIQEIDKEISNLSGEVESRVIARLSIEFFDEYFVRDLEFEERENRFWELEENQKNSMMELAERKKKYYEENPIQKKQEITYGELITKLRDDLNRLIRSLEMYLEIYVKSIQIDTCLQEIQTLQIDKVISFNYTNTYERIYGEGKEVEYDYIHGKADIKNTIETNNMVLGIDEYLKDGREDEEVWFISFKKYYQRILKGTGSEYKYWLADIIDVAEKYRKRECKYYNNQIPLIRFDHEATTLYIFGHSLDITDKDILSELILQDNVRTIIYYYSKDGKERSDLEKKIANLVKIIGKDNLIQRTRGVTRTIFFKQQQESLRD